jgi:hypothetical protein
MIENILTKEYENLVKKPNEVLTIFSNFYGEDNVELQGLPSLEDFIRSGYLNIAEFHYYNIRHNDLQSEYLNKNGYNKSEIDYTLNNPEIFELFYKDFILYHINSGIFSNINIMVYIPEITITNENDKSLLLKKFFIKLPITVRGLLQSNIYFNRAEYTPAQLRSNYMHSHIPSITHARMSDFKASCLGNGPIRDTILLLNTEYDEDRWVLLCLELQKYLEVESLKGGPYLNLEGITDRRIIETYKDFKINSIIPFSLKVKYSSRLISFFKYLINSDKLKFNYFNGSYNIAMNFIDFNLLVSNEFIKWWNEFYDSEIPKDNFEILIRDGLLKKAIINNNIVQVKSEDSNFNDLVVSVENQNCCTFKGQIIPIRIISSSEEEHDVLLLNSEIINSLYKKILILININYGTRTEITDPNTGSQTTNYRFKGSSKTLFVNN